MRKLIDDKGQAGLSILLSLVVMLFVIGLLIMVFTLMGDGLKGSDTVTKANSQNVYNESIAFSNTGVNLTQCLASNKGAIKSINFLLNNTANTTTLNAGNYTWMAGKCEINASGVAEPWTGSNMRISYTYTYAGNSYDVINDTGSSIATTTDWFDIFIVIGAMVVLILLTVVIITAIRGSGMVQTESGGNNVGTA